MKRNIKGEYNLIVLDGNGNVKEETGYFNNLILDGFFTVIQSSTQLTSYFPNQAKTIAVGTGTTAPTNSQSTLIAEVARIGGGQSIASAYSETGFIVNGNNWTASATMTFTFGLGQFAATLSEVGFAFGSSQGAPTVHSRALIVNENGDPTSVTVTAQDQLVVNYRLTISGNDTDGTGTVNLGGTNYNWISRRAASLTFPVGEMLSWVGGATSYAFAASNAVFGAAGVAATGTNTPITSNIITGLSTGQRSRRVTASVNDANLSGGIKCIQVGSVKFDFTPAIPKDSSKVLNLDLAYTFTRT